MINVVRRRRKMILQLRLVKNRMKIDVVNEGDRECQLERPIKVLLTLKYVEKFFVSFIIGSSYDTNCNSPL